MTEFKFNFKNFRYIKKGNITLSNLTIICGKNNVGKTYLNYSIYGFFNSIIGNSTFIEDSKLDKLLSDGFINLDLKDYESMIKTILKKGSTNYSKTLNSVFATEEIFFKNSSIDLDISKLKFSYKKKSEFKAKAGEKIVAKFIKPEDSSKVEITLLESKIEKVPMFILKDIINTFIGQTILNPIMPTPHIITCERTGVVLFHKELDFTKNRLLDYIAKKKKKTFNPLDFLGEFKAQYPICVQQNIDWIRNLTNTKKTKSELWENISNRQILSKISKQIIKGEIKLIEDELFYVFSEHKEKILIPIHTASSSIKSHILLDSYIKNIAKKGDLLIIDEPELNLHPDLQVLMARLIARLTNLGIKILITTHSDYILKEFNNLIMLSSAIKKDDTILKKLKYESNEILNSSKVKVYLNKNNEINNILVDKYGINFKDLDDFILDQNKKTTRIFNLIEE